MPVHGGSRARGNHVHIFKADVDDVHTRRVSTGGFDVDSHDIVHIASRKISVTPIRFAVFSHPTQLRRFSGFRFRTVIKQRGAARTGYSTQVRTRHGIVTGSLLTFLCGTTGGAAVNDVSGSILNIIQRHSPGSQSRTGQQHRNRDALTSFLGDRPQSHRHANLSQNSDFVAQPTVRVSKRARQPIGSDKSVVIHHERAVALRDGRFEPISNRKIIFQQGVQLRGGKLRRRGPQHCQQINVLSCGGTNAVTQVKGRHPSPVDRLVVGVIRHRCRPLFDVLLRVIQPGKIHRRFVHTCPS